MIGGRCVDLELIKRYASYLASEQVAPRTARLYLRAAEVACETSGRKDGEVWQSEDFLPCLKATPGHSSSLSKFAGFLRKSMGWDVRIPPKQLWQPDASALATKEVQRLKEYLGAVRGKEPSKMSAREIVRILSAALGATIVALNQFARAHNIRATADGGM